MHIKASLGLLLVAVCLVAGADHEVKKRLPRDILPSRYHLSLAPDMTPPEPPFPVESHVSIHITAQVSTSRIVLNSLGPMFTLSDVSLQPASASKPEETPSVTNVTFDLENEFVYIELNKKLKTKVTYKLSIDFANAVDNDRYGIYYAPYLDNKGHKKYLVTTQLEPIGARRLMPCFDEVDMKASFDVSITRHKRHTALSNGRKKASEFSGDYVTDHFETTPKMSAYLLAVVIGDLTILEAPSSNNTRYEIRTSTIERLLPYMEHAKKHYVEPLQLWIENVTNIPYALDKIDHVAIHTFGGAMENWGLIIYSERMILVSNETSPAENKLTSATTISHELSHMWYGNLVTCSWWSHLWIQEGVASYYNFRLLSALGWDGKALQQARTVHNVLIFDENNVSTPLKFLVDSPQNAMQAFNPITYGKGAAILRMVEGVLTKEVMEKALENYLRKFQYGVADSDDLLKEFTDQARESGITQADGSGIDFKLFFDPWLDQKGYPLVKVVSQASGRAVVTQGRYLSPRQQNENEPSEYGYKWDVPLTVVDASTQPPLVPKGPDHWLKINDTELSIRTTQGDHYWFIVNPDQMFFYRVWYDERLRKLHSRHLLQLSGASRAQIFDDSFSLARNGYYTVETALDNTEHLHNELYHPSWAAVLRHLNSFESFFRDQEWFPRLQAHFAKQARAVIERIGETFNPNDPIELELLRTDLFGLLVSYGDKKSRERALQKASVFFNDPQSNPVNANELAVVACLGVSEGGAREYSTVKSEYHRRRLTPIAQERTTLALAMTCSSRQSDLMDIINELNSNTTFFEREDLLSIAGFLASKRHSEDLFWNYLNENWETQKYKFYLLNSIIKKWHTTEQLEKLKSFREAKRSKSEREESIFALMTLKVEQNVKFFNENVRVFENWLDKKDRHSDMTDIVKRNFKESIMDTLQQSILLAPTRLSPFEALDELRKSYREYLEH